MESSSSSEPFSETTLEELKTFTQGREEAEKRAIAMKVLVPIAKHGISPYPYASLKAMLDWMALQRIDEASQNFSFSELDRSTTDESKQQIKDSLDKFTSMPFTLQRFCEVLVDPSRYYRSPVKLSYALEKLLRVTGSVPDVTPEEYGRQLEAARASSEGGPVDEEELAAARAGGLMMALDVDLRPPPAVMMGLMGGGGAGGGGGGGNVLGGLEEEDGAPQAMVIGDEEEETAPRPEEEGAAENMDVSD